MLAGALELLPPELELPLPLDLAELPLEELVSDAVGEGTATAAGANRFGLGIRSSWPIDSLSGLASLGFAAMMSDASTPYLLAMSSKVSLLNTVWMTLPAFTCVVEDEEEEGVEPAEGVPLLAGEAAGGSDAPPLGIRSF